jgi:hypothetical protein
MRWVTVRGCGEDPAEPRSVHCVAFPGERSIHVDQWTPAARPLFVKDSGCAPKGIRTPDLHLERVAS